MQNKEKVVYRFSDIDLVAYLLYKNNKIKNIELSYNKKFSEYKLFIFIEGDKEELLYLQDDFNKNKRKIITDYNKFNDLREYINNLVTSSICVQTPHRLLGE